MWAEEQDAEDELEDGSLISRNGVLLTDSLHGWCLAQDWRDNWSNKVSAMEVQKLKVESVRFFSCCSSIL